MGKTLRLCMVFGVLTGCATTTDPRQGGLFNYRPAAYEQRLEERRKTLQMLEKKRQEQPGLEREVQEKRQLLAEQKKQLTALDEELAEVHQRMTTYQAHNREQAAEKARLGHELQQAKARLQALQQEARDTAPQDVEEKHAKIQQLRADIEKLTQVINVLIQSSQ